MMKIAISVFFCLLSGSFGRAQQAAPPQSAGGSVEIRETMLPDGTVRYSIPVQMGSQTVQAALDTGSVGLRVLSRALQPANFRAANQPLRYGYGSGVRLTGVEAQTEAGLGSAKATLNFQLVNGIQCVEDRPHCPASRVSFEEYGLMGDGIPGAGFPAIIGIKSESKGIGNPLRALGIQRWSLALPAGAEAGRLDLNPQEASGFVAFPLAANLPDALRGCLQNDVTHKTICGVITLDTGAPGILVTSPDPLPDQWRATSAASLLFQDAQGNTHAVENFRTDIRAHRSHLRFERKPEAKITIIHAGVSPYLCFAVLYEPDANTISLKPRAGDGRLPRCSAQ